MAWIAPVSCCPGSRAAERFLFRLSPGSPGIEQTRERLKKAFPDALIADYRESHPIVTQGLNRATTFLSLVSLITLIVGAIGVGTAMQAHIQQRMDSIAIMKCIGARSMPPDADLSAPDHRAGAWPADCWASRSDSWSSALSRSSSRATSNWSPPRIGTSLTAAQGIGIAILASLLFTLPPLLGIRRIRPSLILRREMEETKPGWRTRLAEARASIAAGVVILIGIRRHRDVVRHRNSRRHLEDRRVLRGRAGGQPRGAVRGRLADAARAEAREPPQSARLASATASPICIVPAIMRSPCWWRSGVGVMFTLTVYLVQHGVIAQMNRTSPPGMPNVFLIDIAPKDRDAVLDLVKQQRGVEGTPELIGTVAAKIVGRRRPGRSPEWHLKGFGRRYPLRPARSPRRGAMPDYVEVVDAATGGILAPTAVPSLHRRRRRENSAHRARRSPVALDHLGQGCHARVACIHRIDSVHLASRVEFIFNTGALAGFPIIYYGSLRAAAVRRSRAAGGALRALPDRHGGEHGRRAPDRPGRGGSDRRR